MQMQVCGRCDHRSLCARTDTALHADLLHAASCFRQSSPAAALQAGASRLRTRTATTPELESLTKHDPGTVDSAAAPRAPGCRTSAARRLRRANERAREESQTAVHLARV